MAPAHIPVLLFQKPSTENGITRHICNFVLTYESMIAFETLACAQMFVEGYVAGEYRKHSNNARP